MKEKCRHWNKLWYMTKKRLFSWNRRVEIFWRKDNYVSQRRMRYRHVADCNYNVIWNCSQLQVSSKMKSHFCNSDDNTWNCKNNNCFQTGFLNTHIIFQGSEKQITSPPAHAIGLANVTVLVCWSVLIGQDIQSNVCQNFRRTVKSVKWLYILSWRVTSSGSWRCCWIA